MLMECSGRGLSPESEKGEGRSDPRGEALPVSKLLTLWLMAAPRGRQLERPCLPQAVRWPLPVYLGVGAGYDQQGSL